MATILLNCLTLGLYKPCSDEVCTTARCQILEGFDHLIFAFFAVEMCIKVCALGLIGKNTYLASTWNRLDMFIVFAGSVVEEYFELASCLCDEQRLCIWFPSQAVKLENENSICCYLFQF